MRHIDTAIRQSLHDPLTPGTFPGYYPSSDGEPLTLSVKVEELTIIDTLAHIFVEPEEHGYETEVVE